MTIAVDMPLKGLVAAMLLNSNRKPNKDDKYVDFLVAVLRNVETDANFSDCLEVALKFSTGPFPTLERVEKELARMGGAIRPLLEEKGIVEPMPKVEEV